MKNIDIFEKHFRDGMINKTFEAFKCDFPTLLKCIIKAMDEVNPKGSSQQPSPRKQG